MPPSSPQFTPAQVLHAGRRAEADGKLDLAEHFFRHVVEQYGATAEAAGAREGLARLLAKQGVEPPGAIFTPSPSPPVPATEPGDPAAALAEPKETLTPEPLAAPPRPALKLPPAVERATRKSLPADAAGPRRPRSYRLGRVAAAGASIVGGAMVLTGLALVPLAMTRVVGEQVPLLASPAGLAATAGWAAVQVFAGLIVILLAQVARAVFDLAATTGQGEATSDR